MSCYVLLILFFSFIYSSQDGNLLRLSGTVLNYEHPQVRFDSAEKMLYCGSQNYPIPVFSGLQDGIWIGGEDKLLLLRSLHGDCTTTFTLMADGKERNSFSSPDNSQCLQNQKRIIGAWGADTRVDKILVAWLEFLITAKDENQSINSLLPVTVFEMVEKKSDDFHPVRGDLKILDIFPKSLENNPLLAQSPVSFAIEKFPFSSRIRLFPHKILFSPDSKCVLIQTDYGFILQSLISTYPLQEAEVFAFTDDSGVSDEKKILQNFAIKWIANDRFWFMCYTNLVIKFVSYSKQGFAWWSDKQPDTIVNSINDRIALFNKQKLELLRLRFDKCLNNASIMKLFGIFKELKQEQLIADIYV